MARRSRSLIPKENEHRNHISDAMKRLAERRRCPKCGRKGAVVVVWAPEFQGVLRYCRWPDCRWEKSVGA
jgi:hypothetical protein